MPGAGEKTDVRTEGWPVSRIATEEPPQQAALFIACGVIPPGWTPSNGEYLAGFEVDFSGYGSNRQTAHTD
jgi:hypothetical protein